MQLSPMPSRSIHEQLYMHHPTFGTKMASRWHFLLIRLALLGVCGGALVIAPSAGVPSQTRFREGRSKVSLSVVRMRTCIRPSWSGCTAVLPLHVAVTHCCTLRTYSAIPTTILLYCTIRFLVCAPSKKVVIYRHPTYLACRVPLDHTCCSNCNRSVKQSAAGGQRLLLHSFTTTAAAFVYNTTVICRCSGKWAAAKRSLRCGGPNHGLQAQGSHNNVKGTQVAPHTNECAEKHSRKKTPHCNASYLNESYSYEELKSSRYPRHNCSIRQYSYRTVFSQATTPSVNTSTYQFCFIMPPPLSPILRVRWDRR